MQKRSNWTQVWDKNSTVENSVIRLYLTISPMQTNNNQISRQTKRI